MNNSVLSDPHSAAALLGGDSHRQAADSMCRAIRPAAEDAVAAVIAGGASAIDPAAVPLLPGGGVPARWWQAARRTSAEWATPREAAVAAAETAAGWLAELPAQIAAAAARIAAAASAAGHPDVAATITARGATDAARAQLAAAGWQATLSAARLAAIVDPAGDSPAEQALVGVNLHGQALPRLTGITITGSDLTVAALPGSDRLTLADTALAGADITGRHDRPDWSAVDLAGAKILGAFTGGRIEGDGDRLVAERCTFTGCAVDLSGAAHLGGVRIDGGSLTVRGGAAVLTGAALHSTRLTVDGPVNAAGLRADGCGFGGAWAAGSSLVGAELTGCLITADLSAMDAAALVDVRFEGCRIDRRAAWPQGFVPPESGRAW